MPLRCLNRSREAGLELATAAALLMQETGGGKNIYGHDPTIFAGAGEVTRDNYAEYRRQRDAMRPRRMQGVGPMQRILDMRHRRLCRRAIWRAQPKEVEYASSKLT